jgi:hypothetical protein
LKKKTDLVKWYFEVKNDRKVKNKYKYKYVKNMFVSKYPRKVSPTKQTVLKNVNTFLKYGSVVQFVYLKYVWKSPELMRKE